MMNPFGYSGWGAGAMFGWGFGGALFGLFTLIFVLVVLALKGYALWHAAKRDEKWWFVILLVVNTAGILELCYLIFVVKKWHNHMKGGTMNHHHDHHQHHDGSHSN